MVDILASRAVAYTPTKVAARIALIDYSLIPLDDSDQYVIHDISDILIKDLVKNYFVALHFDITNRGLVQRLKLWFVDVLARRPFNSKEDLTQKISTSVFVTNFPDHCTARDLWNVCLAYGKVIDVYIPFKKSKAGKKFAFVRFLKVDNLERLIGNLCTLWIGRFRLQANPVKFQREPRASNSMPMKGKDGAETKSFASVLKSNHLNSSASKDSTPAIVLDDSCIQENDLSCAALGKIKDINALPNLYAILHNEGFADVKLSYLGGYWVLINSCSLTSKEKLIKHTGVLSWFSELGHANNLFVSDVRLVWTAIEGLPICAWNKDAIAKIVSPWGKIYWIRIRELEAWSPEFDEEFYHVSESSCMKENNEAKFIKKARTYKVQSEDPFEIYDLLKKKATKKSTQDDDPSHPLGFTPKDDVVKEKEEAAYSVNSITIWNSSIKVIGATQDDDPSHPPGFTPKDDAAKEKEEAAYSVNQFSNNGNSLNNGVSRVHSGVNQSFSLKSGGSIMDVIENLVDIGQTMGYNMEGCKKNLEDIVASHGDSQVLDDVLSLNTQLSYEQIDDLECDFTYDELSKGRSGIVVTNKSLGPAGFTFDSYCTNWRSLIRCVNAIYLKGIRNDDLDLVHLFYADDAEFSCKLMGIGVSQEEVRAAASIIGCSTFSNPFTYLGVKVGMSSSKRKSWDEVIAPMGVLRDMESFRRRFFNGIDKNERKISMIEIYLPKDVLLVSVYLCVVWKTVSFECTCSVLRSSPWNCIIKELSYLSSQGINLLAHLKKKVGNGVHTSFWKDSWINDIPLSQSYPRLYALENKKHITVAEKISEATIIASFRKAHRGGVVEDQFIQLVELVD
ncbi:RNA-directed DNA polymerase, eukaryota [Tanacetum coccineum]